MEFFFHRNKVYRESIKSISQQCLLVFSRKSGSTGAGESAQSSLRIKGTCLCQSLFKDVKTFQSFVGDASLSDGMTAERRRGKLNVFVMKLQFSLSLSALDALRLLSLK